MKTSRTKVGTAQALFKEGFVFIVDKGFISSKKEDSGDGNDEENRKSFVIQQVSHVFVPFLSDFYILLSF